MKKKQLDLRKVRRFVNELCFEPMPPDALAGIALAYTYGREPEMCRAVEIALGHLREMIAAEKVETDLAKGELPKLAIKTPRRRSKPKPRRRRQALPSLFLSHFLDTPR